MREWTTSACVVLAWSILMPLLAAADLAVSGHPAQATTTTSITQLTLAKAPVTLAKAPVALAKAPGNPCTNTDAILASGSSAAATATATDTDTDTAENNTWTVRQGDTLSAIATAVGVPGGWQALYAVNRRAIGPNPDVIHPGIILTLPRRQAPMRYTVMPGDTLSSIAAALATPVPATRLAVANRAAINVRFMIILP